MRLFASALFALTCIGTPSSAAVPSTTARAIPVDLVAVEATIEIDLDMKSRVGKSFDASVWVQRVRPDGFSETYGVDTTCDIRLRERLVSCDGVAVAKFTIATRTTRSTTIELQPGSIKAYQSGMLWNLLKIIDDDADVEAAGSGDMTDQICSPPGSSSLPNDEVGCAPLAGGREYCCNLTCTYTCESVGPDGAFATWGQRDCNIPTSTDCWVEGGSGGTGGGGAAEVVGDGSF